MTMKNHADALKTLRGNVQRLLKNVRSVDGIKKGRLYNKESGRFYFFEIRHDVRILLTIKKGFHELEIDCKSTLEFKLTKDGELYLSHEFAPLDRLSASALKIAEFNDELKKWKHDGGLFVHQEQQAPPPPSAPIKKKPSFPNRRIRIYPDNKAATIDDRYPAPRKRRQRKSGGRPRTSPAPRKRR